MTFPRLNKEQPFIKSRVSRGSCHTVGHDNGTGGSTRGSVKPDRQTLIKRARESDGKPRFG